MYLMMYVYEYHTCTHTYIYYYACLYISRTNKSNETRNRNEEFGLFCYNKVVTLPMKWNTVI